MQSNAVVSCCLSMVGGEIKIYYYYYYYYMLISSDLAHYVPFMLISFVLISLHL